MAADDLMKIRITADFKQAEGAFLKMAKVATAFESDFKRIAGGLNKEFNKINGMAELFGNSTNVVKDKMDALKRSMEQLMTLGLQPMNPQVQKLKAQYDGLAATLQKTEQAATKSNAAIKGSINPAKNSNKQMMSLALILQDLPYGFRGIQNNLPALFGSIAGVAGVGYLAFSAIVAGLTFWDEHNRKVAASTKKLKEEQDAVLNTVTNEAVRVNELIIILENENETRERKKRALKDLQSINPDIFKDLKLEGDSVKNLNTYYNAYIENLKNVILLKKYEKDLEALVQADLKKGKPIKVEEQKQLKKTTDLLNLNNTAVKDNIATAKASSGKDQNIIKEITDYNKRQQDKLDLLEKIRKISPSISLGGGDDKKGGASPKDNFALDSLRAKQKAYKDDIYAFRAYGILIINEEERLAVERAKTDGTYLQNKKDLHARYDADRLTNNNLFEEKLNKVLDDNAKIRTAQEKKELDIQVANRLAIANAILAINKQFAEDNLRNAILFAKNQTKIIETELAVQDKLNRNNLTNRIQFTEEALAKLVALAAFTFDPKVLAVYLDAIDKVNAKLKGMGKTWDTTANQIKGILEGVMANSITKFAENIGTALAGGKVDLFGGIGEMIAEGAIAIGKALIAYGVALKAFEMAKLNPVLAIVAGAGLVIAGTVLKAKLAPKEKGGAMPFANGGIISGPTMGLMGEYPGAKSNPEVVAPLDKLKGLIGGNNGGTLEARISGNDLLILMNKAQRNNNTTF
jgi:hypothetical protein